MRSCVSTMNVVIVDTHERIKQTYAITTHVNKTIPATNLGHIWLSLARQCQWRLAESARAQGRSLHIPRLSQ